jgi:hypothetical protein
LGTIGISGGFFWWGFFFLASWANLFLAKFWRNIFFPNIILAKFAVFSR